MSNTLNTINDYLNKYTNNIAKKNIYEIVKGFEYQELTKDPEYDNPKAFFSNRQFVNIRTRLNITTKKQKNPNLQIKLDNFIELNTLRQNYKYVIGYDGIENENQNICKSFIKLVLGKWNDDKTKIEKIKTFMVLESENVIKHLNGGIENQIALDKLFDLMENWIFKKSKDKELIENYENLNFYIVADKHRTIVNKINRMKIDGFITSNPTTYEKFENQNFKIKEKIRLSDNLKEFNTLHFKKFLAINK